MEAEGVASESSWSSFNAAMAAEESDLLGQFYGGYTFSNEQENEQSMLMQSFYWPDQRIDQYYGSQDMNSNMFCWPMEKSCNFASFSYSNNEGYYNNMESNMVQTIGKLYMEEQDINHFDAQISMNDGEDDIGASKKSKGKRKIQSCEAEVDSIKIESFSKKKVRASWQAGKSSVRSSKSKKDDKNDEVGNASIPILQSSSSEDEANNSEELSTKGSKISLNSNGKKRAGRGSATDPQSLYARKRRERINERLKILQNLVPNGTKVDISTMLEEAVQYVKFLQVQIKLLSSDDLWMYAPIAYNGMNIGFDLNMSSL